MFRGKASKPACGALSAYRRGLRPLAGALRRNSPCHQADAFAGKSVVFSNIKLISIELFSMALNLHSPVPDGIRLLSVAAP
jgi:hypothetical protein